MCLLHVAISKGLSLIFIMIKTQHHIATGTLRLTRADPHPSPSPVPVSFSLMAITTFCVSFAGINPFVMRLIVFLYFFFLVACIIP